MYAWEINNLTDINPNNKTLKG